MQAEVRDVAGYPGGHAEGYPDTCVQLYKAIYGYKEPARKMLERGVRAPGCATALPSPEDAVG